MSDRSPKFVSLFSGAGGLDIGMEMAGWEGLYASDIDQVAVETLRRNKLRDGSGFFQNCLIEQADVSVLDGKTLLSKLGLRRGEVPLLVGGPPCQTFSSAGRQKGFKDPRGRLFRHFVRVADELGVDWILFENVRGLLTARGEDGVPGSALEAIRKCMLEAGYQTKVQLVNSADYGVPQRRVRLFLFGYRVATDFQFPVPTHSENPESGLASWKALGAVLEETSSRKEIEIIRPSGKLAEQLRDIPEGSGVKSPGKKEATRPGGHWGYKQGAFVADRKRAARTVTANSQQDWVRDRALGLRRLAPTECAAIQTFPNDWEFAGKRTDQYRQIGNAVPPLLAYRFGANLISLLEAGEDSAIGADLNVLEALPPRLAAAIDYTKREHKRNGPSRDAAPDRRREKAA